MEIFKMIFIYLLWLEHEILLIIMTVEVLYKKYKPYNI